MCCQYFFTLHQVLESSINTSEAAGSLRKKLSEIEREMIIFLKIMEVLFTSSDGKSNLIYYSPIKKFKNIHIKIKYIILKVFLW